MSFERRELQLTLDEFRLVIDALHEFYDKQVTKAQPKDLKEDEEDTYKGRKIKEIHKLAFVQETLQYITTMYNVYADKVNPNVAAAYGIQTSNASDSSRE